MLFALDKRKMNLLYHIQQRTKATLALGISAFVIALSLIFVFATRGDYQFGENAVKGSVVEPDVRMIDYPHVIHVNKLVVFSPFYEKEINKESTFEWKVDGQVISHGRNLTYAFEEAGTYEISLLTSNGAGSDLENFSIDVVK